VCACVSVAASKNGSISFSFFFLLFGSVRMGSGDVKGMGMVATPITRRSVWLSLPHGCASPSSSLLITLPRFLALPQLFLLSVSDRHLHRTHHVLPLLLVQTRRRLPRISLGLCNSGSCTGRSNVVGAKARDDAWVLMSLSFCCSLLKNVVRITVQQCHSRPRPPTHPHAQSHAHTHTHTRTRTVNHVLLATRVSCSV
jgi:hypothetical protein